MPFSFEIQADPETGVTETTLAALSGALSKVSDYVPDAAGLSAFVTVRLVPVDVIVALHDEFFDDDSPTDIVTFPAGGQAEAGEPAWEPHEAALGGDDERYLGDIAICVEVAREQAIDAGHSLDRELVFLALHGILHLVGYDDQADADRCEMLTLQERVLSAIEGEIGAL